ncbi:putative formin-related protein [Cryptosporidium canis]|uniref:Formin-related protein n=1 Tax=Cryptosporidium canis TaxID=195482 RepID=A0A9D5DFZ1_9CRYT|nr:putative formin-related protein [Cryptosporidium canis]
MNKSGAPGKAPPPPGGKKPPPPAKPLVGKPAPKTAPVPKLPPAPSSIAPASAPTPTPTPAAPKAPMFSKASGKLGAPGPAGGGESKAGLGKTVLKTISKVSKVSSGPSNARETALGGGAVRQESKLLKDSLSKDGRYPEIGNRNTFVESTLPFDVGPIKRLLFQDKAPGKTTTRRKDGKNLRISQREDDMFNLHVSVLDPALTEAAEHSLAALSQTFKEEFASRHFTLTTTEKNNLLFGQTTKARPQIVNEKFEVMTDSLLLLQRLEESRGDGEIHELQRIIQRLRAAALEKFMKAQYSDAMLNALHCYEISRAFLSKYLGHPLEGIMVVELIIIAKCCGLTGELRKGEQYLKELRFLVENTILAVADRNTDAKSNVNEISHARGSSGPGSGSGGAGHGTAGVGPSISCEPSVLCSLVLTVSDLCSMYRDHASSAFYLDKYLSLVNEVYGPTDLVMSDAYSTAASYYFRVKNFEKCREMLHNCLEIRKKVLGDHSKNPPHPRVADCYSNLGLVYRILGDCRQGAQYVMIALDMLMRIYNNREFPLVQDNILALGCIFHQAGNFRYALELYNEVYKYRRENLGFDNPDTRYVLELITLLDADTQVYLTENVSSCTDSYISQGLQSKCVDNRESLESRAERSLKGIFTEMLGRSCKLARIMYEESSLLASPLCPSIDQLRYRQLEAFLYDPKNAKAATLHLQDKGSTRGVLPEHGSKLDGHPAASKGKDNGAGPPRCLDHAVAASVLQDREKEAPDNQHPEADERLPGDGGAVRGDDHQRGGAGGYGQVGDPGAVRHSRGKADFPDREGREDRTAAVPAIDGLHRQGGDQGVLQGGHLDPKRPDSASQTENQGQGGRKAGEGDADAADGSRAAAPRGRHSGQD